MEKVPTAIKAVFWISGVVMVVFVLAMVVVVDERSQKNKRIAAAYGRIIVAQGAELDRLRKRIAETGREIEQVQRSAVNNHFRLVGMAGTVEAKEIAKLARTSRRLDRIQKDVGAFHDRVKELRWAVETMAKNIPGRARAPRYRWKQRPK